MLSFFMSTASPEIYTYGHTRSLHDALPICRFTNDAAAFCQRMLAETGIAATPGFDFDRGRGPYFMRFSFAGATDRMVEAARSEEHTSELQSLMRISYAVFCLKKKRINTVLTSVVNSFSASRIIHDRN